MSIRRVLSYNDILLSPNYSPCRHKDDANILYDYKNLPLPFKAVPLINAPMDLVCSSEMLNLLHNKFNMPVTIHRFFKSVEEQLFFLSSCVFKTKDDLRRVFLSVGSLDKWKTWIDTLIKYNESYGKFGILIDMANGDSIACIETAQYIRKNLPNVNLMAGNIATKAGYVRLEDAGVNILRAGIGGGCLTGDTRILMSNGFYKYIKDVKPGDKVINRDGNSVAVKKVICSGIKSIKRIKISTFYSPLGITDDHKILQYDCNDKKKVISSEGYSSTIKKLNEDWMPIGQCSKYNILLSPKNINIEYSNDFNFNNLNPTYELGYVFGTFLGDGFSQSGEPFVKSRNKTQKQGSVRWSFNKNEVDIADKLIESIKKVFDVEAKKKFRKNIIEVFLFRKYIADLFLDFGKRQNKHLPENLLVDNKEYLKGIYDGLVDSDGSFDGKRYSFTNTSTYLIELFNILCFILKGYFPLCAGARQAFGNLKDCVKVNDSFEIRELKVPQRRMNEKYNFTKILSQKDSEDAETYDLEIDCPTHSFVANNIIVHNSICSTRIRTGFGVPTLTSVMDCAEIKSDTTYLIADGGIENYGDICKSIVCGANMVMVGKMLAATDLSSGTKYTNSLYLTEDESQYAWVQYRGMASKEAAMKLNLNATGISVEGASGLIPYTGKTEEVVSEIFQNLKSAMAYYGGCTNWIDFARKVKYNEITQSGWEESKTRLK